MCTRLRPAFLHVGETPAAQPAAAAVSAQTWAGSAGQANEFTSEEDDAWWGDQNPDFLHSAPQLNPESFSCRSPCGPHTTQTLLEVHSAGCRRLNGPGDGAASASTQRTGFTSPQTGMERDALPLHVHISIGTKCSIENGGSSPLATCHHFSKKLHQVNSWLKVVSINFRL